MNYPPASEASREVANLTEGKNPHNIQLWKAILYKKQYLKEKKPRGKNVPTKC